MPENFEHRKPRPNFRNLSAPLNVQILDLFVLSLSTSKRIDTSAGTFTVTLVPSPDDQNAELLEGTITKDNWESFIYRSIRPMDVVTVGMDDETIMFGFVDKVYKSRTTNGNNVSRSIVVEGRDATKLFIEDSIANAPELSSDSRLLKFLSEQALQFLGWFRGLVDNNRENIFADSYPVQAIFWILNNIPSMQIQDTVNGIKRASGLFLTNLVCRKEDSLYDNTLAIYSGKILTYMQQCIDPAYYELWIDTIPKRYNDIGGVDTPCLFLRPKPFDREYEIDSDGASLEKIGYFNGLKQDDAVIASKTKDYWINNKVPVTGATIISWEKLTCPVKQTENEPIEGKDILQYNVGVSDLDVMNMFKVLASGDPVAATAAARYGMYFPLLDAQMVQLFGVREIQANSRMIPPLQSFWVKNNGQEIQSSPSFKELSDKVSFPSWKELTVPEFLNQQFSIQDTIKIFPPTESEKQVIRKRDTLWRWMRYNHLYETGTSTIKGRHIRVGGKVFFKDEETRGLIADSNRERYSVRGMEFYINGVQQNYTFGGNWTTTLAISMGHNPSEIHNYYTKRKFNEPANTGREDGNQIFTAKFGATR